MRSRAIAPSVLAVAMLMGTSAWGEKPGTRHARAVSTAEAPPVMSPASLSASSAHAASRTATSASEAPALTTSSATPGPTIAPTADSRAKGDAGAKVSDSKDAGGAKQFNFTQTDIEGRLRAPQLIYFLRRVRAEFAAGDLGHRSFLRELSQSQREPPF